MQLYIPTDSILNDYGNAFEVSGNRIYLKKSGLFSLSAVVILNTQSTGVIGLKYTYRGQNESYEPKSGTVISRQTHHFVPGTEALTASGLFYGVIGDYITIEIFHDVRIMEDSNLDIRVGVM